MNSSLVGKLVVITVIMFGFGYALVPLYEAFCRITGFGGKTDIIEEAAASSVDVIDRDVAITFTSHTNSNLPWKFKPIERAFILKRLNVFVFQSRYCSLEKSKKWQLDLCLILNCQKMCMS